MKIDWKTVGLVGVGALAYMSLMKGQSLQSSPKYEYNVTSNSLVCKDWQYIESEPYKIILNNSESISINISYLSTQQLDISDIRFHNVCSTSEGYGKIYAYVNGSPALPTIGAVNTKIPIYIGFPSYPSYGTQFTTIWDTDDVRGKGTFNYTYVYEGITPLYIKTIELYVTNKI